MTLKLGVIGAGRIGRVHANTLVTRVPSATVVAIADIFEDSAKSAAQQYNIKDYTTDPSQLIRSSEIDAVVICSSTDTHCKFIIEAAQAGKQIFCEKPISFDLSEIDAALHVVKDEGVKLQIGFNRRFDPNFMRLKQAIIDGAIGTPHTLTIISRDPAPPPIAYIKVSGGLFFDMTIHDFDMCRFLMGDVEEMYAVGDVKVDPAIGEAGDIDTAKIMVKFTNGVIGTIENSRQAKYGYDQRAEVFGSEGVATSENIYPNAVTISDGQSVRRDLPLNFFMERYLDSYANEMIAFVDAVVNDKPVPVVGNDGRVPVVMALAGMKSMKENRPVKLSEIG